MLKEFITNPVIIGLVAGAIVYAYLSWNRKKYVEKRLKKGKKIKDTDKYDDIIIPIIVAVLVWFIAIGYINYKKTPIQQQTQLPPTMNPAYKLIVDQPSDIHNSFTLVRNGITLPSQMGGLMQPQLNQNPIVQTQLNQVQPQVQPQPQLQPQTQINQNPVQQPQLIGVNNQNIQAQLQLQPQANLINPNMNNNVPDIFIN